MERLEVTKTRLADRISTTVVVGEFKRGKSTLVNALLQMALCPVDADIVTAVPTRIRYGETVSLTAYEQGSDGAPTAEEAPIDQIGDLVTEAMGNGTTRALTGVEVTVPHRMLRSGLCLVDTPGVGGLDSVHGQLTLAMLTDADSVLFVTDAGQELTAPELDFLRTSIDRCASAALVVTKIDIYPEWRRVVDLDRSHLQDAGIQIPVIPVSSFLRLRAARHPTLNEESGFRPLVEHLARAVVVPGTARAAEAAARDAQFVASQLARQSDAERVVLARPSEQRTVVNQLEKASRQAGKLASASAGWQQVLSDGIQDLVADVEHDLHQRLRKVLNDVETVIDQGDPKDAWQDVEVWLRRQVAVAGVENRDLILQRARALSNDVAERFDLDGEAEIDLELAGVTQALERLELGPASGGLATGSRIASIIVTTRVSMLVPVILYSVGSLLLPPLGLVAMAGAGAAVGAGVGGKMFRDEGKRQLTVRRQTAKGVARKFVDDVAFVLTKETRDGLRAVQRQLRDDFQTRAVQMQRSTAAALESARRAAQLSPEEKAIRARQVTIETQRLQSVRSQLREVAVAAAPVAAVGAAAVGVTLMVEDGSAASEAPGPAAHDTVVDDHG